MLALIAIAVGAVGLALLLPRPTGGLRWVGLALMGLAAVALAVAASTSVAETAAGESLVFLGNSWTWWTIAGLGTFAGIALLVGLLAATTKQALVGLGAMLVGVAAIVGLAVDLTVGLTAVGIGLALLFRLGSTAEDDARIRPTSEPWLASIAGGCVTAVLWFVVDHRFVAAYEEPALPVAMPAAETLPIILGGVVVLIGLAFLAVTDGERDDAFEAELSSHNDAGE